jgi:hypothetical protein
LETAAHIGLDLMTFWELTPFEFSLVVNAYIEKEKQKEKDRLAQTYLGAAWQRAKKLPNFKKLLGMEQPQKKMTNEEMLLKVKQLNAAFGGDTY